LSGKIELFISLPLNPAYAKGYGSTVPAMAGAAGIGSTAWTLVFETLFDCAFSSQSDDIFIVIVKVKFPMPAASHKSHYKYGLCDTAGVEHR
jgi:hypothetical protein